MRTSRSVAAVTLGLAVACTAIWVLVGRGAWKRAAQLAGERPGSPSAPSPGGPTPAAGLGDAGGTGPAARHATDSSRLVVAARSGDAEEVRRLLAAGADPNFVASGGRAPLIVAAERGDLGLVQLLLRSGADVAAAGDDGRTALHRAAELGHTGVVRWLAEHGARIEAWDRDGATPLERARAAGQHGAVTVLAGRGADGATDAERNPEKDLRVEPPAREQGSGIAASSVRGSSTSRGWDGPILPGYGEAALLNVRCSAGEPGPDRRRGTEYAPGWRRIRPRNAAGFTQGEEVVALRDDGTRSRARLGELGCVAGECRGDWVTSRLDGVSPGREVVAIAPRGFLGDASRIVVPRASDAPADACSPVPAHRLRRTYETGCQVYDLGDSERLQVYWFANADLENWGTRWLFARRVREKGPGSWRFVGRAFGRELSPAIAIRDDGPTRVVWAKCEGIGGPCETTVVVTRVTDDGIEVGRAFTAGGQPCD